jgi:hypothetical protein
MGNAEAQLAYVDPTARWTLPSYAYKRSFVSSNGAKLDIVFFDSVIAAGIDGKGDDNTTTGGVRGAPTREEQLAWLDATLAACDGHVPEDVNGRADALVCGGSVALPDLLRRVERKQ